MKRQVFILTAMCILISLLDYSLLGQEYIVVKVDLPQELKAHAGDDMSIAVSSAIILGDTETATGGTGKYYYAWFPSEFLDNPNIANPIAIPTITTTFTVIVLDDHGCSASDDIAIVVGATSAEDTKNLSNCVIYPNPTDGKFYIQSKSTVSSTSAHLQILDILGKVIYNQELAFDANYISEEIDISQSPSGVYFVKITDSNIQVSFKLFKN